MSLSVTKETLASLGAHVRLSRPRARVAVTTLPYVVRSAHMKPESPVTRGLYTCTADEVMCVGPYNSGKTYPILHRLYWMHCQIPNLQTLILRKKKVDLYRTTIPQWQNKVLPFPLTDARSPCKPYGKGQPQWYDWKNGGRTWVGNCEEAGGYLSGEYDIVFFCQAEQASLQDWELVVQRADGRAGNWKDAAGEPLGQTIGDCNPDVLFHWIPRRLEQGLMQEIRFRHEDNMLLYRDGAFTKHGERTVQRMAKSLTGVRYKRGFLGQWASAEGAVFDEFNPDVHVIDDLPDISTWNVYRGIDFGYDHPFVCIWVAREPKTNRLIVFKEWRYSKLRYATHADEIRKHGRARMTWADWDAEPAEQLRRLGVPSFPANKEILPGIDRMKLMLAEEKLLFYRDALIKRDPRLRERSMPKDIIEEMQGYSHRPLHRHTGNSTKDDLPIPKHDDGIDALRYIINGLALPYGMWHPGVAAKRRLREV